MECKLKEKQKMMKLAALEFIAGANINDVMKKYHICYASVYNAIKKYKLEYNYSYGRTIFFNTNYFENIDNEHKAYWLGFIFADGCVTRTDPRMLSDNRLTIAISAKDIELLEQFANDIEIDKSNIKRYMPGPKTYGDQEMCSLYCNSVKLVADLAKIGCKRNKAHNRTVPLLKKELSRHFIRGYFDGDGNISHTFNITSELHALESIQAMMIRDLGFRKTKISQNRGAWNMQYGGRLQLIKIFHYLYDNATVFLQRKYDKFRSRVFTRDETISSSLPNKQDKELCTSI